MERDFLGLSSKEEPLAKVKEEIDNDGAQGYSKSSGVPPPMPFKISAEDKTAYPVAAASDQRRAADAQKTFNLDRQGGPQISLAAYPMQSDLYSIHRPHETKLFSVPNQGISVSLGNPSVKNPFALPAQMAGPILKQPLGGVPVSSALNSFFPPFGSISGITEPWNSMKPTGGSPAQLTIFYGGTVKVYDDISPERAQAIMFLAGAGASISNIAHQKAQAQAHGMGAKMAAASDGAPKNQPVSTLPCPALSSPLSVSSHTGAQSGSGSSCSDELGGVKTNGLPTTPISKGEPPRIVNAVGPVAATAMLPSAVPQARKASLARFLEKRKERVMSSAPYNLSKKHPECAATESNGANFSSPITSNSANVAS
ncbi:protein TIFY 6B-like isoform X1 [Cucurbita pepo subsp. pepo]|uniref:protein TIFY 6B-like isoform X1 n=1 Tax=Cucurbita pepo subsp. pepo TaxID=3664 RepID=UPI000C9D4BE9|nr:protein TIFY 6B-like isoform X1 [Cucurbita pepo subsp. pepo]XP_023527014.1 protein TIFY 6B-like isoform X1 [Cucurbita pepo subsp. pepo]